MTTTKRSRIFSSGNATTLYLTLPAAVVSDSQFPFAPDDAVQVIIDGETLQITAEPPLDASETDR